MRLEFAPEARRDLFEIAGYIAHDNPIRAASFVGELESVCRNLTAFPQAAPLRPDFGPGIRGLTHGAYAIFYSALTDKVRIERVIHGSRDIPNLP